MITKTRTIALTAAAAALGTAAIAPEAVARPAKVTGGRTSLTLTKNAVKTLKRHHVKVIARAPGWRRGRTYWLPVRGGKFDFGTNRGTLAQRGSLRLKRGRRAVVISGVTVTLGRKAKVTGKVGGRKVTLAVLSRRSQKVRSSSTNRRIGRIRFTLTRAAVKQINRRLGGNALRGRGLGALSVQVPRPRQRGAGTDAGLNEAPASSAKVGFAPAVAAALSDAGLAPTAAPGATQLPDGTIELPVAAASIDPQTGSGTVDLAGGVTLGSGDSAVNIEHPSIEVGGNEQGLYANVNGVRVKLAGLEQSGLGEALRSGAKQLSDILIALSPEGAAALNQAGGVTLFVPGTPFGDISLTLPGG